MRRILVCLILPRCSWNGKVHCLAKKGCQAGCRRRHCFFRAKWKMILLWKNQALKQAVLTYCRRVVALFFDLVVFVLLLGVVRLCCVVWWPLPRRRNQRPFVGLKTDNVAKWLRCTSQGYYYGMCGMGSQCRKKKSEKIRRLAVVRSPLTVTVRVGEGYFYLNKTKFNMVLR